MKTKTLQEQIDKFYEETGYQLKIKDGKPYYDGYLDLFGSKITKLPDNLVVSGSVDLRYTNITELPENLVVSGCLDLYLTKITKLPDSLVVGGCLDLEGSNIVALSDNLVVGGKLYLYDTLITELPDNLIAGGGIYGMSDAPTPTLTKEAREKGQKIRNFLQWKQGNKTYIKADGVFSVVDNHRGNVWRTHRVGKQETLYVVTDGEGHYAHGNTLKEAKDDLIYKINDRDTSIYENLSLDSELSFEEAIAMYRTITGACSAGTRYFIESRLPKPYKEKYSLREIIELTDGEYGSEKLKKFFQNK